MNKLSQPQDPELWEGSPIWWHQEGCRMRLEEFNRTGRIITIISTCARVVIAAASSTPSPHEVFYLKWEIRHSASLAVGGRVALTTGELKAAFALSEESGEMGDSLIARYGADSAETGKFIRWRNFLNFPCPGTGEDGDPNVSVEINDEMKEAIQELVGWQP